MAVLLRLLPHPPNVAPIASLALFSGVMISGSAALVVPIVALLISDVIIGFHSTIPYVYGSFLLIVGIGVFLKNDNSPVRLALGSIVGSTLFFIITNFGSWITSITYEKSVNGLLSCYTMGIPFFRNTIVGDLLYTGVFFLTFELFRLLFVLMLPSRQNRWERHTGNTV